MPNMLVENLARNLFSSVNALAENDEKIKLFLSQLNATAKASMLEAIKFNYPEGSTHQANVFIKPEGLATEINSFVDTDISLSNSLIYAILVRCSQETREKIKETLTKQPARSPSPGLFSQEAIADSKTINPDGTVSHHSRSSSESSVGSDRSHSSTGSLNL